MEQTTTLYHIDGREQTVDVHEASRLVGPLRLGAGKGWSFVKPAPANWEREIPRYKVVRDIRPAQKARYRFEPPFEPGTETDVWQYGSRSYKAGEIVETKDWPHLSFTGMTYGAKRILEFFNTRMKSRLPTTPWHLNQIRLDDGMSGPLPQRSDLTVSPPRVDLSASSSS